MLSYAKEMGIAAASFYRTVREETKTRIEYTINSKQLIAEKEAQLNKLFADIKTLKWVKGAIKKSLNIKYESIVQMPIRFNFYRLPIVHKAVFIAIG
jgi:hypothetical protein